MSQMYHRALLALIVGALTAIAPHTHAVTRVVEKGDPAPDIADTQFYSFRPPVSSPGGDLAFIANLDSPSDSSLYLRKTLWSGKPADLSVIAREELPNALAGETFSQIGVINKDPLVSDEAVAFDVTLDGSGDAAIYVYHKNTNTMQQVARTGGALSTIYRWAFQDGYFAVYGQLDGVDAILTGDASGLTPMLKVGDPAPGFAATEGEVWRLDARELPIAPDGTVVFVAGVQSTIPGSINAVYAGKAGSIRWVNQNEQLTGAFSGCEFVTMSQGANATYRTLSPGGAVMFFSRVRCDQDNHVGLFVEQGQGLMAAVSSLTDTGIPDTTFNGFYNYHLGKHNTLVAFLTLSGEGITNSNNTVVVAGTPGNVTVLAREGGPAPDEDGFFYGFQAPTIDGAGDVTFEGRLTNFAGPERTYRYNGNGLERLVATNTPYFVASEQPGQNLCGVRTFGSGASDYLTLSGSQSERGTGGFDGKQSSVSAAGDYTFRGYLTTSPSEGIYTTQALDAIGTRRSVVWLDFGSDLDRGYRLSKVADDGEPKYEIRPGFIPLQTTPAASGGGRQDGIAKAVCEILEARFKAGQLAERIPVSLHKPSSESGLLRVRFGEMVPENQMAAWHGFAINGIDRFNQRRYGDIHIVLHNYPLAENRTDLFWGQLVVHEVGHEFGLRHHRGAVGQGNAIMDYLWPEQPEPTFADMPVTLWEPPTADGRNLLYTQNPLYHLLRYGWCDSEPRSACPEPPEVLKPGTYDTYSRSSGWLSRLKVDWLQGLVEDNLLFVVRRFSPGSGQSDLGIEFLGTHTPGEEFTLDTTPEDRISLMTYSEDETYLDIFFGTGDASDPQWGFEVSTTGLITGRIFQFLEASGTYADLGGFSVRHQITEVEAGTDPTDTDGDGLSDEFETTIGSDPTQADSDGDGLTDYEEVAWDGDAQVYSFAADLNPALDDTDGDGTLDGEDTDPLTHDGSGSSVMRLLPNLLEPVP